MTFMNVELRKISRTGRIVIEQVPLSVAGQALSLTTHRVMHSFVEKFRLRLQCDPHATDGSLHAVMAAIAASLRTLGRLWRNEIGITLPHWAHPTAALPHAAPAGRPPIRHHGRQPPRLGDRSAFIDMSAATWAYTPKSPLAPQRIRPSTPTDIALA